MRKHNCFTSGAFRLLSERITRAMAEHFKDHPHVIGWQTDNEFGGHPICFCHTCRANFQDWLQRKYGTLDELNRAWGTHFWSQGVRRLGRDRPAGQRSASTTRTPASTGSASSRG